MSTFKMPKKLIQRWISSKEAFGGGIRITKDLAGLGFRDLEMLNHALLTKLAWRICTQSDHLVTQVLKAKYFKHEEFLHINAKRYNTSWIWRGIEVGLKNLQLNCCMEMNNGKKTRIWLDNWIYGMEFKPVPNDTSHFSYVFVNELMLPYTAAWNVPLLNQLFSTEVVNRIKCMIISPDEEDEVKWKPAKDGVFTVKSAYNKLVENRVNNQAALKTVPKKTWKSLWSMNLPH
ncbi:uncharacterized protein LOC113312419 [Papaver somniferum]|uniref:uncharacterized protein LOC113312419 n=1 Tax=Papaver somniferum TaxID=3469 RepID=UPI000E6FC0AC|nr:uncharacterized protein LOC113312419 [Papaver somniferum]